MPTSKDKLIPEIGPKGTIEVGVYDIHLQICGTNYSDGNNLQPHHGNVLVYRCLLHLSENARKSFFN
jgi:hypothetical protein